MSSETWQSLFSSLTEERRSKLQRVAAARLSSLRLILQDTRHPHNISACMRSAEAFGVQDVSVVTLKHAFQPSSVARGVSKWLRVRCFSSIEECVLHHRNENFAIAAGFPSEQAQFPLREIPVDRKIALLFGNEHDGVHEAWIPHLDIRFTIPTVGMVESLNISVSCAISLYAIREKILSQNQPELFDAAQQQQLLKEWAENRFEYDSKTT